VSGEAVGQVSDDAYAAGYEDGQRDALRAAADDWQVGGWANVLLPKPTPPAVPVIAYSNRVLDWLRDRAAAFAADPDG
jgi:hypothetical protein